MYVKLSKKFRQRPVLADQILRPPGQVGELRSCHVNSQPLIERRENFAEMDRPGLYLLAPARRRAQNLAASQAAAGHQGAGDTGPVVAPGVRIDLRRAPELSPDDDGNIVE